MTAGPESFDYKVIYLPETLLKLKGWSSESIAGGFLNDYLMTLRTLEQSLRTMPMEWGDPLRFLDGMEASSRRGSIVKWIVAWYAVHIDSRTVFVREMTPAPGSPLSNLP